MLQNNSFYIFVTKKRFAHFFKRPIGFDEKMMLTTKKTMYDLILASQHIIQIDQYLDMNYTLFVFHENKIVDEKETLKLVNAYNVLSSLN